MLLATVAIIFAALVLLSMPIVFALGIAGIAGLLIGGYPMQQLSSALVSGSQSWVLLAIPAFVFAGNLMERCGMSHALVELARALIGWVKGGLGMSVIVVAYFFSDICGSKMAEVSALGSALMPPLTKAGYDRRDSASLIAAGTAMGMLVPPAIFMIVIAQVTNTSAVALFVAGFVPAMVIMLCLMARRATSSQTCSRYRTRVPGGTSRSSAESPRICLVAGGEDHALATSAPPIFRGARFATTITCLPTSVLGRVRLRRCPRRSSAAWPRRGRPSRWSSLSFFGIGGRGDAPCRRAARASRSRRT